MIILASSSPRRREILKNAGFEFTVRVSDADESLPDGICAPDAVKLLSRRKAEAVYGTLIPGDIIVAADTVVELSGKILGKPRDSEDAFLMLSALSGKTHSVYTGVTLLSGSTADTFAVKTEVEFFELTKAEIREYILSGEPADKAGAYGIQGKGSLLVKGIHGDYFNVMGLPVSETARRIKKLQEEYDG